MLSPKESIKHCKSGTLRKNKMEVIKTQNSDLDMYRLLQKMKTKKSIKPTKELPSFQKDVSPTQLHPFVQTTNKKKYKNTKSQVQNLAEKYPVRFHTDAFDRDDCEVKLKKSHGNPKMINYSRSALRLQKSSKADSKF